MGRATILSEYSDGQYDFTLLYDEQRALDRITEIDAKLTKINDIELINLQNALNDAQADVDAQYAIQQAALKNWTGAPNWQADTGYNVKDRVRISGLATMVCQQQGRSGGVEPEWPAKQGDTVRENHVIWSASLSASSLPGRSINTDYDVGDERTLEPNFAAGENLNGVCIQAGRSLPFEPAWKTGQVEDGGIIWRREDHKDAIKEETTKLYKLAVIRDKAQIELDRLRSFKLGLEKEKAWIEARIPIVDNVVQGWCADLTEALSGEVRSLEINNERSAGIGSLGSPTKNAALIYPQSPPFYTLLQLTNGHRTANGKLPLHIDWRLYDAAQTMADFMAATKTTPIDHAGPGGNLPCDRALDAGYPAKKNPDGTCQNVSENILSGATDESDAFNLWKNSPAHNTTMLNSLITHVGFARATDDDEKQYYAAVFGFINGDPDRGTSGKIRPAIACTAAEFLYALMLEPGWAKWRPTFRIGTIAALDKENDIADVDLDFAGASRYSDLPIQHNINTAVQLTGIPVRYMTCNAGAFEVGDRVVVEFAGQHKDHPYVIGFETNPKACAMRIKATRGDGLEITPDVLASGQVDVFSVRIINETGGPLAFAAELVYVHGVGYVGPVTSDGEPLNAADWKGGYWVIPLGPDGGGVVTDARFWIEVDTEDALKVQYPSAYKSADRFDSADLQSLGTYDVTIPFWREVVNDITDPATAHGILDFQQVQRQLTLYTSVPYRMIYRQIDTLVANAGYLGQTASGAGIVDCTLEECGGAELPDCGYSGPLEDKPADCLGTYFDSDGPFNFERVYAGGTLSLTTDNGPVQTGAVLSAAVVEVDFSPAVGGRAHYIDCTWSGPATKQARSAIATDCNPDPLITENVCEFVFSDWPLTQGGTIDFELIKIDAEYDF